MKRVITFLVLVLLGSFAFGQYIQTEVGKVSSEFAYEYADGRTIDNVTPGNNVFVNLGYKHVIPKTRLSALAGLSYKTIGATASEIELNNYYAWDINYMGAYAGLNFELLRPYEMPCHWHGFTVGVQAKLAMDLPLSGVMNANNLTYNIVDVAPYDATVYYAAGGLSLNYYLCSYIEFHAVYNYQHQLKMKQLLYGTLVNTEQIGFQNSMFGIGFSYGIGNK